MLFHKDSGNDFEVYNDFNGLLANLHRCVREKPAELMEALRYVLSGLPLVLMAAPSDTR